MTGACRFYCSILGLHCVVGPVSEHVLNASVGDFMPRRLGVGEEPHVFEHRDNGDDVEKRQQVLNVRFVLPKLNQADRADCPHELHSECSRSQVVDWASSPSARLHVEVPVQEHPAAQHHGVGHPSPQPMVAEHHTQPGQRSLHHSEGTFEERVVSEQADSERLAIHNGVHLCDVHQQDEEHRECGVGNVLSFPAFQFRVSSEVGGFRFRILAGEHGKVADQRGHIQRL
mmetsp:Transcript_28219/g.39001  ORF Transcript_28219/g.39001 Transcript_28219/m.39001 type:complete len:229 (-) Transcript_28219:150-836(-)